MVSGRGGKRGEHDRNRRIVRLRDGDMDLALVAHDVFARSLDSSTTSHAVVFRRAVNRHSATPLVEWAGACRCPATGRFAGVRPGAERRRWAVVERAGVNGS